MVHNHRMPRRSKIEAPDDPEFGWDPPTVRNRYTREHFEKEPAIPPIETMPAGLSDEASPPAPELLALGAPPADAAGIQKWHYQALSTMAFLVLKNENLTDEQRLKRFSQLTQAAAKHYPAAAQYDLSEQIRKDAEAVAGRKRAKASAKLEPVESAAGSAKVIPLRRDA